MTDHLPLPDDIDIVEKLRSELAKLEPSRHRRVIEKFALAVLGSIPWVGGFLSAAASYKAEDETLKQDSLQTQWLEEHQQKISLLRDNMEEIGSDLRFLGWKLKRGYKVRSTLHL